MIKVIGITLALCTLTAHTMEWPYKDKAPHDKKISKRKRSRSSSPQKHDKKMKTLSQKDRERELVKAQEYFDGKQYDKALKIFTALDNPATTERLRVTCWYYLGLIHEKKESTKEIITQRDYKKAIAFFKKVITTATSNKEYVLGAQFELGYLLNEEDKPEGEELLKLCALQDDDIQIKQSACMQLCTFYLEKNRKDDALPLAYILMKAKNPLTRFQAYSIYIQNAKDIDDKTKLLIVNEALRLADEELDEEQYPDLTLAYNAMLQMKDTLINNGR